MTHDRIMTKSLRKIREFVDSVTGKRCDLHAESVLHTIRN
ncbi:uncharacterized protein G2W53_018909 [Senna tora]|uniref:Uncharacterized protein n=1 Tax=Senna tora TaxID=362788 RepID=A0A834TSP3_9FABA|nr:uncharacterized protein G2W53_018909 [Senna tora]